MANERTVGFGFQGFQKYHKQQEKNKAVHKAQHDDTHAPNEECIAELYVVRHSQEFKRRRADAHKGMT